jgi:hypothetical protein
MTYTIQPLRGAQAKGRSHLEITKITAIIVSIIITPIINPILVSIVVRTIVPKFILESNPE